MSQSTTATLDHLGILEISGDDRKTFLQGQLTCDMNQLAEGEFTLCAQCDAKGKVLGISYLLNTGDRYLQIHRRDQVPAVQQSLGKFAVFSKVELSDVSEQYSLFGFTAKPPIGSDDQLLALSGGRFLLLSKTHSEQPDAMTPLAWEQQSIAAGEPLLASELVGAQVPQEFNLDALDGISFTKGCYIGQETIARMHYRGGIKRRMYLLSGQAEGAVTSGMDLEMQLGEHWRRAGRTVRVAQHNDELSLLAILPADLAAEVQIRISGDEQSRLSLQQRPYTLETTSEDSEE